MDKTARLYRKMTPEHICPFGLKAKDLLEREGFAVEDHQLGSKEEAEAFKRTHKVDTTPQVFIADKRIGGYEALRDYLGKPAEGQKGSSYVPVIAIFALAGLMTLALCWRFAIGAEQGILTFIALAMCLLAVQKLRDITAFSNSFITYDLLAMRWVRYAYIYPFAEAYAGIAMLANLPALWVAPVALFIGSIGGISVIKAVYIDKRELKCACVGGNSDVPLGFISLSENLMMAAAALWMLAPWG